MTYNKLTDEEIIKRLEYMRKNADEGYMAHLENGGEVDKNEEEYIDILCGTLDLINCLQSENKRLGKEVNLVSIQFQDLQERYEESQMEIERLNKVCQANQQLINALNKSYFLAKAEAYKEFAERLKEKSFQSFGNYGITRDVVEVCDIDNLVKELNGG